MTCRIDFWASQSSSKVAIEGRDFQLTYKQLDQMISAYSYELQNVKGPISIRATQRVETIAFIFGAIRSNTPILLTNPALPSVSDSIIHPYIVGAPKKQARNLPYHIDENAPLIMYPTSGSSGEQKIVCLTPTNIAQNACNVAEFLKLDEMSSWILTLPLFHIAGLALLCRMFFVGGKVIWPTHKDQIIDDIARSSPSFASIVPTQLYQMLNRSPEIIAPSTTFLVGGGATPPDLLTQAHKRGLSIMLSYAMTEMGSTISLGTPIPATPLGTNTLAIDGQGRVCVGGPTLFAGYFEYGSIIPPQLNRDGLFTTNDLGLINKDGELILKGRNDKVINKGGEKIPPLYIENALYNLTDVEEAVVIGIEDKKYGAVPVAFVKAPSFCELKLKEELKEFLSTFFIPTRILPMPPYSGIKPSLKLLLTEAMRAGSL